MQDVGKKIKLHPAPGHDLNHGEYTVINVKYTFFDGDMVIQPELSQVSLLQVHTNEGMRCVSECWKCIHNS